MSEEAKTQNPCHDRPQFVIDREQSVIESGDIQGIHVWYHSGEYKEVPP